MFEILCTQKKYQSVHSIPEMRIVFPKLKFGNDKQHYFDYSLNIVECHFREFYKSNGYIVFSFAGYYKAIHSFACSLKSLSLGKKTIYLFPE